MALRVLLADESTNIKKVMQLALQDFGVEVKSVPVGTEVLALATSFHPHIVFADILLSKRSGYDVSEDLRTHKNFSDLPVILMWSGFMELDEARFKSCKASDRLEKPFDADTLRKLVKKYVPALQDNAISNYLSFPNLPEILPSKNEVTEKPPQIRKPNINVQPLDIEDLEEFQQVPLPKQKSKNIPLPEADDEMWSSAELSKVQIKPLPEDFEFDMQELSQPSITHKSMTQAPADFSTPSIEVPKIKSVKESAKPENKNNSAFHSSQLAKLLEGENMEEILRQEMHRVLQEAVWKILPGVAERVIREEIDKLLLDADNNPT